ncbi:MAG: type III-A CRISPR-associated protein Cas10/Csm1 [Acetobacteraceae bacterium]|nr:type III-A CRISPR-associated protein Cas10/Csm1 [Acetobacteraceae bacterium]
MDKVEVALVLAGLTHDLWRLQGSASPASPLQRGGWLGQLTIHGLERIAEVSLLDSMVAALADPRGSDGFGTRGQGGLPAGRLGEAEVALGLLQQAHSYATGRPQIAPPANGAAADAPFLVSPLTRVVLHSPPGPPMLQQVGDLSPARLFPVAQVPPGSFEAHCQAFRRHWEALVRGGADDAATLLSRLLVLLERFAWCVAAHGQDASPHSLLDHLRCTAAISLCLYRYHRAHGWHSAAAGDDGLPRFRLVAGDLSGIQPYIFGISHTGAAGVAKRLRARSFYLGILTEAAAHRVLHLCDLPLANLLICSGGHFYVLVPNTPQAEEAVRGLRARLDGWLLERFQGELRLILADVPLAGVHLRDFRQALDLVGRELADLKSRPFAATLRGPSGWLPERFRVGEAGARVCPGCLRNVGLGRGSEELCPGCEDDLALGQRLPRARAVALYAGPGGRWGLADGYSFDVWDAASRQGGSQERPLAPRPYLVALLNSTDVGGIEGVPAAFRFVANHMPAGADGEPLDFDALAARAAGAEYLGVLKADVDHLGAIFTLGLARQGEPLALAQACGLSRLVEQFFSACVGSLVQRSYPLCYVVFAGGDDLFLVGPWDQTVDLAAAVNDEFRRFCGGNPNVTLSAGISLVKARFPVAHAAVLANQALDDAKDPPEASAAGRDSICCLGDLFKWAEMPLALQEARSLRRWVEARLLPRSFLRRLLHYHALFLLYHRHQDTRGLRFIPLLTYDAARNLRHLRDRVQEELECRRWVEGLKNLYGRNGEPNPSLLRLGFSARHALAASRGREGE